MEQTVITKFLNRILVIFGFAGSVSCATGNINVMYGVPTMDFEVSGKVVNHDSVPVAGIKVSCSTRTEPGVSSVLTAGDGSFVISGTGMSALLNFEDIDGPENGGEFADKSEEIEVEQVGKGDGSWYKGKFEAKGVVIEMKEKK